MTSLLDTPISRRTAILTISCVIGVPIGYIWLSRWQTSRFYEKFGQLIIGMSEEEVVSLFARAPDSTCVLGDNRVLYYRRGAIADKRPRPKLKVVDKQEDLPWFYGCAQLLFDIDTKLSAFTVIGEVVEVTTREGNLPGSAIQTLDPVIFKKLCRAKLD